MITITDPMRWGWKAEREMPQRAVPFHRMGKPPADDHERDWNEGARLGRDHPDLTLDEAVAMENARHA